VTVGMLTLRLRDVVHHEQPHRGDGCSLTVWKRGRMRLPPDADREGRPGNGEVMAPGSPDDGARPPQTEAQRGAEALAERLRPARRARRRTRLKQAVYARRRSLFRWSETATRITAAVAILALMATVSGIGSIMMGAPTTLVDRSAVRQPGGQITATEIPTVAPAPRPTPETLPGPEVSVEMIEANGPVSGCALHQTFADLGARIGPSLIGHCVEDPQPGQDGDLRQRTTHGEVFWFAVDSRVAFTDGAHVWLSGPDGIARRRIDERFAWERDADAGPRPGRNTHVLPPAPPNALLPARRIVSYYGNPLSSGMGILGELPPEQLFPRLRRQAEGYRSADRSRPVTPALELVTVVAQAEPGADGLYRLRMDTELIEKVSAWAEEQGFLLILDVQIGWGNVDEEVAWLLPFLKRPHVHLALDPEFAMPPGQKPGERIGTMDAKAINSAMRTLAELIEAEQLPPKLLLVHRFTEEMVTGYRQIQTDPRVQVVMVMDGFGSPAIKSRQYDDLVVEQRVQYTGFKLFYKHDEPLMTPEQVLLLDPPPDLIIYQ